MLAFVRKLRHAAELAPEDEEVLLGLTKAVRRIHPRGDIVPGGSAPRSLTLVLEGWAYSYKELENGKRQIISFLLPGDLYEPFGILPNFADQSLAALTPVTLAQVSPQGIRAAARDNPNIERALWWDLLVSAAIERERVVSLGRRSASERLGHLFCELHLRLSMVGLAHGPQCDIPLTQIELGDALGLSSVHVNRSIQELRASGMMSLRGRRLIIHDIDGLRAASLFDPAYLHMQEAISG